MSRTTTCENPRCVCDPCTCARCRCGAARLGPLERQVIDVLWDSPRRDLAGRDVADALPGYAYTTVATVLHRLVHKGLVSRRMEGRTSRFSTTDTRAAHTAQLMRDVLAEGSDPAATLVQFVETMSQPDVDVVRRALAARGRRRRGGR
jgi:predicted transcriptional regulator